MKFFFFIFFLFIFWACKERPSKNNSKSHGFPVARELTSQKIESIPFSHIGGLVVIDTFLVTLSQTESSFFQIYGSKSHNLIAEFSSKGRGPGEFLFPNLVSSFLDDNSKGFWVYDPVKGLFYIDLMGSLLSGILNYHHDTLFNMPEKDVFQVNFIEKKLIGLRTYNDRFGVFNKESGLSFFVPFSATEIGVPVYEEFKFGVFASFIGANPKNKKLFSAFRLLPRIEFFDLDGNYLHTTVYDNEEKNKEKLKELFSVRDADKVSGVTIYLEGVNYDNSYIYLLFQDINEEIFFGDDPFLFPNSQILVFDWDGIPIKRLLLDKFVGAFAIDVKQNKIFAYCPLDEDFPISVFEFNGID